MDLGSPYSLVQARVKVFKEEVDKSFGFATLIEGEFEGHDCFFHRNNCCLFLVDGEELELSKGVPIKYSRAPEKSDLILVKPEDTHKGLRTPIWAFYIDFLEFKERFEKRKRYRFQQRRGTITPENIGSGKLKIETLWEGEAIRNLRERFPKEKVDVVKKEDFERWFEVYYPQEDCWDICEDPR